MVFVDTTPPPPGADISEFPLVDGVVPFPGWEFFDAEDVEDLDDAEFAAIAEAEVVRLGTGHWPQFSAPDELAWRITEAVR